MERDKIIIGLYTAPCGQLVLGSYDGQLCLCDWQIEEHRNRIDRRLERILQADIKEGQSDVIDLAARQLDEYFSGVRRDFDVPLLFAGSDFQKLVWNELRSIPYGMAISYGELACRIGRRSSVRAVANANGANPISIFVPCHRVIGSDGSLTGYGGGLSAKSYLLQLEHAI